MSCPLYTAALLLRAFIPAGGAVEAVYDQRPVSDFIFLDLDKTSVVKGGEAVLTLRFPEECGFRGIQSPDFSATEKSRELIEYQPHRHALRQGKTLVPVSSRYSGGLTTAHAPLNQRPAHAEQTHKHHLRESAYSLKFLTSGEVSVGPLEIVCDGNAYRTARRKVRVSSDDENLFRAVDPRIISGPGAAQTSGPLLDGEPPTQAPEVPAPGPAASAPEARTANPGPSSSSVSAVAGRAVPDSWVMASGVAAGLGMLAWLVAGMVKKLSLSKEAMTTRDFSSHISRLNPFQRQAKPEPQKQAGRFSASPRPLAPRFSPPPPKPSPEDVAPAKPDPRTEPKAPAGLPAFAPLPKMGPPSIPPQHGPFPAPTGAGKAPPAPTDQPGKKGSVVAGRYEIVGRLGEGGMGTVLLGHDTKLSRKVAVKLMKPEIRASPKECARFLNEARIIAKLRHPYIVGIHDIIDESGQIYLILDFVDGKTLLEILDEKKRLPLPECKHLFAQVCEAVDFAHRNKVLHRDLKPGNIIINKDGFAFVADFGIAREAKDTISRATQTEVSGSPAYMAPEQHLGEAGKASDIFSLGVILYEMLVGQRPYTGLDFLAQKERRMYTPPSEVFKELNFRCDRLFESVLDPAADQRPESAMNLYQRLKEL